MRISFECDNLCNKIETILKLRTAVDIIWKQTFMPVVPNRSVHEIYQGLDAVQ